jgi:hypothetical protein
MGFIPKFAWKQQEELVSTLKRLSYMSLGDVGSIGKHVSDDNCDATLVKLDLLT